MTDPTTQEHRALDPIFPVTATMQGLRIWQAWMIASTAWWNSVFELWSASTHVAGHVPHHDEHAQLVVPDPIEKEGEKALVA